MRFALATALLLGGLAACSQGPSENAPLPAPAAEPMPAAPPASMPAPTAGTMDGPYVGTATGAGGRGCAREQDFDMTVSNNGVSGTVAAQGGGGAASALSGHIGPNGKAVIHLQPQGAAGPRGTLVGTFANGQFTGRLGAPCRREVTASKQ